MPLTPNFTVGQNPLTPNILVATDVSSGADAAITQRRIYISDANGVYLVHTGTVTDYTQWSYSDPSISLDILDNDTAVSVTVQWLDVSNAVLYTLTQQFSLAAYSKQFLYYLVQLNGIVPTIPSSTNYDSNTALFWATILGAINAVTVNNDIAASQNALNRCNFMRLHQSQYF